MYKHNGNPFIATLHNILLAPDLCDMFFSIITLVILGDTCLFHKNAFTVHFGYKKENSVTLPYIAQRKHAFLVKTKEKTKAKKKAPRKKVALVLLHHG